MNNTATPLVGLPDTPFIFLMIAVRFGIYLLVLGALIYAVYYFSKSSSMDQPSSEASRVGMLRSLYFYLASFVGLILIVVAVISLLSTLLKATIFTKADNYTPGVEAGCEESRQTTSSTVKVRCEQIATRQRDEQIMSLRARRQNSLAQDIGYLVIGIPLFGYHIRLVRRKESNG